MMTSPALARLRARATKLALTKFNPNHGPDGKFSSGSGGGSADSGPTDSPQARQDRKERLQEANPGHAISLDRNGMQMERGSVVRVAGGWGQRDGQKTVARISRSGEALTMTDGTKYKAEEVSIVNKPAGSADNTFRARSTDPRDQRVIEVTAQDATEARDRTAHMFREPEHYSVSRSGGAHQPAKDPEARAAASAARSKLLNSHFYAAEAIRNRLPTDASIILSHKDRITNQVLLQRIKTHTQNIGLARRDLVTSDHPKDRQDGRRIIATGIKGMKASLAAMHPDVRRMYNQERKVTKFNPNHGADGKFSSGSGGSAAGGSASGSDVKANRTVARNIEYADAAQRRATTLFSNGDNAKAMKHLKASNAYLERAAERNQVTLGSPRGREKIAQAAITVARDRDMGGRAQVGMKELASRLKAGKLNEAQAFYNELPFAGRAKLAELGVSAKSFKERGGSRTFTERGTTRSFEAAPRPTVKPKPAGYKPSLSETPGTVQYNERRDGMRRAFGLSPKK